MIPDQYRNRDFVPALAYKQFRDELCLTSWNKTMILDFFFFFFQYAKCSQKSLKRYLAFFTLVFLKYVV